MAEELVPFEGNRTKVLTVLEALMFGMELDWEGYRLVMSDAGHLVLILQRHNTATGEVSDHYVGCDLNMGGFVKWADSIPEGIYAKLCADLTVTKMKQGHRSGSRPLAVQPPPNGTFPLPEGV